MTTLSPHHALLIVDVQRAFDPPPRWVEKLSKYSRRFRCRIFTRYLNPPGSMFRRVLRQNCCAPGSADLDLLIAPNRGDVVIDKAGYGLKPSDLRRLKRRGISRVTVCGLDTDACVLGVMFSLFDAGIRCELKPDLCWSSTGLHREAVRIAQAQFHPPSSRRTK